jgi:branched-subunit amino acid transport protein
MPLINADYLLLLLGMGAVTFLPRWLPFYLLSHRKVPDWLFQWLQLIPVAVLSALLLPALVTDGVPKRIDLLRPELLVALPTFLFALKTRSLGGTVVIGMGLYWAIGKFRANLN